MTGSAIITTDVASLYDATHLAVHASENVRRRLRNVDEFVVTPTASANAH